MGLLLGLLFLPGCAARWMNEYHVEEFMQARIDNPNLDCNWNTGDVNGNGRIDNDEITCSTCSEEFEDTDFVSHVQFGLSDSSSQVVVPSRQVVVPGGYQSFGILGEGFFLGYSYIVPGYSSGVTNKSSSGGAQIMHVLRIRDPKPLSDDEELPSVYVDVAYGVGYYQALDRNYYFNNGANLFGSIVNDTRTNNQFIGPQVELSNVSDLYGWKLESRAKALIGMVNYEADNFFSAGFDLVPGSVNSLLVSTPHTGASEQDAQDFSGIAELNSMVSRDITDHLRFQLGANAFYISKQRNAADSINWRLPDFGISNNKGNDLLISSVYASIEFRR